MPTEYGYGRVSTGQQTYAAQADALTAQGIPPARQFLEKAGGASQDRPQLAALLAVLQPGDLITATRLDRFGRSVLQIVTTLADLAARDIHVRTLSDGTDSRTPTGRLQLHIMAALAEYERELIRERAQAARQAALRRYSPDPDGRTNPPTGGRPRSIPPRQLKAARDLIHNGQSLRETAKTLSIPRATLSDALRRSETPPPPR